MKKKRSQPRIIGYKRDSLPSCVDSQIRKNIERDALRNYVSKSWVIAVILADNYGIKIPKF